MAIVDAPRSREAVDEPRYRSIEQRAQLVGGGNLTDSDPSGLRDALDRLEQVDVWTLATSRSLRDLAAGPIGELISTAFRVVPRQPRSMETVERLLAAGEAIIKRKRRLDSLTMETVAEEAGVTQQAAYRYFGDVHALILLAMRRVQVVEHERLLTFMTAQSFETDADLANAAVAFVIQAYQDMARIPAAMRDRIARDYYDICYDVLWRISEGIHGAMAQRGDPCAGTDVIRLAAGFTAVAAVAKSLFLRDIALLRQPGAQLMMVDIFLGALRGGPHLRAQ
ncbi:MAG TPA: TetR/AcrR family transcriptional regulator [Methylocella sp.]|nr:TetR/AcrR family transcriptional regulator [Methylocella sp.]